MSHPINPAYLAEGKKIADQLMEAAFGRSTPSSAPSPIGEIRQAAQHIRDIAAKATPGPWLNLDGDRIIRDPDATAAEDDSDPCGAGPPLEYVVDEPLYANPANGDHIALWDPPAALLVADLLDKEADLGNTGPALLLAREINATVPEGTPE